jgi:BclB C-terminal domain-containing protein
MKKFNNLLMILLIFMLPCFAQQAPQKINYQAVVRNAAGVPVINQNVSFRFSIVTGNTGGASVYTETQSTITNAFGLAALKIGNGTVVSGTFATIAWGGAAKFLKVEADITGGSTYINLATVEMVAVPYALNAETSNDNQWSVTGTTITSNNTGAVGIGGTPDASAKVDISASNKGLLIPRVTFANRPASPAEGLMIYQTDNTTGFYYFANYIWNRVAKKSEVGGTVMAWSSGLPIILQNGQTTALMGFGTSEMYLSLGPGGMINLGSAITSVNYAYLMPRAGTITSMSAHFSSRNQYNFGPGLSGQIVAQLYSCDDYFTNFQEVPGATCTMVQPVSGSVMVGETFWTNINNLSIPVTQGQRFLVLFRFTGNITTEIRGYACVSVNVE